MDKLISPGVVDGYASAMLKVAGAEDGEDRIAGELFQLARSFTGNEELRSTLVDVRVPIERKQAVIADILEGRASPVSIALINLLVGVGRIGDFVAVADRMAQLAADREELTIAEVRSAIDLDEATVARLGAQLAVVTGKRVKVNVIVDPSVVGGIVAKIDDTILDGSIRNRLQQLREAWG